MAEMTDKRKSPADVCLQKRSLYLEFRPGDALPIYDDMHQLPVTIEHRAWVCPFCEQSTEYWMLNGKVVMGSGMATMWANKRESDCCGNWQCRDEQEKFHGMMEVGDA